MEIPAFRGAVTVAIGLSAAVSAELLLPRGNPGRVQIPVFIGAVVPFLLRVLTRRTERVPLSPRAGRGHTLVSQPGAVAYLLSNTCTTGWLHWVPGELWLTDDAIVRVPRGARDAFRPEGVLGSQADAMALKYAQAFSQRRSEITYIPFADIRSARLRAGRTTDRLALDTNTGGQYKFLLPREDQAFRVLREQLWERDVAGYVLD